MDGSPKILVVDDNPVNIRIAAKILRPENYNISFATSGIDALDKAHRVAFDLILLDVMMPEMDGFEICRKLKSDPLTQKIPVIFLTALTESEDIVRGFDAGGADYVTKPFNSKELLARVGTHIRLKHTLDDLDDTNRRLQNANNTKDKLFSIISHDLLGPFGSIRESLEVIANEEIKIDHQNMLQFIRATWNSVNTTYALLENLLYWTRNQQGMMVYQPKKINLNGVIHETLGVLSFVAKNKGITLKCNLISNYEVVADKNALNTILRNILSNAIKFTMPGGVVTIGVEVSGNDFLKITVSDTGIGMNVETLKGLFSSSKHESRWGTRGEKGVGLGLAITKEFVERGGGTIWVESKEGNGSTFFLTLQGNEII